MKILLISADESVAQLCQETLVGFPAIKWQLLVMASAPEVRDADLYIWDTHVDRAAAAQMSFGDLEKSLSRMAAGMFQLSTGRQVRRSPQVVLADMDACFRQAVYEVVPVAEEKGLNVTAHCTTTPRPLYFEPAQIEQVLVNLLDNACK